MRWMKQTPVLWVCVLIPVVHQILEEPELLSLTAASG